MSGSDEFDVAVVGGGQTGLAEFGLPIQPNSHVISLRADDGQFVLDLLGDHRQIRASQVVVATGPFHFPRTPDLADAVAPDVFQVHSSDSRMGLDWVSTR